MNEYHSTIDTWHNEMEQRLRSPDGWLSVVGLAWLHAGDNSIGSDPTSDVVLPASAPAHLGTLKLHAETVTFVPLAAEISINDQPACEQALHDDAHADGADIVRHGSVSFFVIKRGARIGIRIKDSDAPARQQFAGRRWFPIDERYRLNATFTPYDFPKPIEITNVLGDTVVEASVGFVTFELDGTHELVVVSRDQDQLFFVFRDASAPHESYPIRFLSATLHDDHSVKLDFNRAYNPPCAFTPHATCPMPPHENVLPIAIRAGERQNLIDHH